MACPGFAMGRSRGTPPGRRAPGYPPHASRKTQAQNPSVRDGDSNGTPSRPAPATEPPKRLRPKGSPSLTQNAESGALHDRLQEMDVGTFSLITSSTPVNRKNCARFQDRFLKPQTVGHKEFPLTAERVPGHPFGCSGP